MNKWMLTDEVRDEFKPILETYFTLMNTIDEESVEEFTNEELGIDFSNMGINPAQLLKLLNEFEYEMVDRSENGWQQDCFITLEKKDGSTFPWTKENLIMYHCGMTFELMLYVNGFDF